MELGVNTKIFINLQVVCGNKVYLLLKTFKMEIDATVIVTLVGTIAATLGGKEACSYWKQRLLLKAKERRLENSGENELREEIKDMLEDQIAELKETVRLLTKRIKLLEVEREVDKKRIANQEIKITELSGRLAIRSRGKDKDV